MSTPIECERKFLIRYPDLNVLTAAQGVRISEITQTYLLSPAHITDRVRARTTNGNTVYTRTQKIRITAVSAEEYESEISKNEYDELLKNVDPARTPVHKTRYVVPVGKHLAEIDLYPFWQRQAIMEVELSREDEEFIIPPFIEIIREVTSDVRYKNARLAHSVPAEEV